MCLSDDKQNHSLLATRSHAQLYKFSALNHFRNYAAIGFFHAGYTDCAVKPMGKSALNRK